jgi:hypothetical protein
MFSVAVQDPIRRILSRSTAAPAPRRCRPVALDHGIGVLEGLPSALEPAREADPCLRREGSSEEPREPEEEDAVSDVGQCVRISQSRGVLVALDRLRPRPHGSLGDATREGALCRTTSPPRGRR